MTYHIEESYGGSDLEVTVQVDVTTVEEAGNTVSAHEVWGIIDEVRKIEVLATNATLERILSETMASLKKEVDGYANPEAQAIFNSLGYTEQADPVLDFEANPGTTGEILLQWDFDIDHDNFIVDRDTDADFPSPTNVINTSGIVAPYSDSGLPSSVTYFYRAKSQKTGKDDSDYVYANAIAP